MLKLLYVVVLLESCKASASSQLSSEAMLKIEHSIDASPFKEIGHISLAQRKFKSPKPVRLQTNEFDAETLELLLNLKKNVNKMPAAGNGQMTYRLRLCGDDECFAQSFTHMKSVLEANMQLNLTLVTSVNDRIVSIALKPFASSTFTKLRDHLVAYVSVQRINAAKTPQVKEYLKQMRMKEEKKIENVERHDSLVKMFAKLMDVILPVVILLYLFKLF